MTQVSGATRPRDLQADGERGRFRPAPLGRRARGLRDALLRNPILLILAIALPSFAATVSGFATWTNIQNLLLQVSVVAVLVVGQSIVLVSGNFDLSAEGTLVFSVMLSSWLMASAPPGSGLGAPAAVGILVALGVGAAIGLFNGVVVEVFKVPAFIVTLATMLALEGMAAVFTNAQTIIELPRGWSWVGATSVGGFSSIVLVAAGVYVVFAIYLGHSVFGRHLYAVGGDKEAARANGISPLRVVTAAYVLSGILAAVAGWLASSRLDSASPSLGSGIIFTVFAAAVVGGISLQGGRGNLWAAAGGVLLLGCVENVLQLAAISPLYINGIRGLVIVAVVLIDVARRRLIGWLGIQEAAA